MKSRMFVAGALGVLLAAGASPATAQESSSFSLFPLDLTLAVDPVSTYVFRGIDVTDAPALQPWATVALGNSGLSLTAWSSFAAMDRGDRVPYSSTITRGGVDEVDLVAAYSRAAGPVSFGAGYIAYIFPADQLDYVTQEVYGSLGLSSVPFAPTVTLYYDFDDGVDSGNVDTIEGLYATIGGLKSIPVGMPLDIGLSAGYTDQKALRAEPGFNDLNVSAGIPIPFQGATVTPTIGYTRLLENSAYAPGGDDIVWAKFSIKI